MKVRIVEVLVSIACVIYITNSVTMMYTDYRTKIELQETQKAKVQFLADLERKKLQQEELNKCQTLKNSFELGSTDLTVKQRLNLCYRNNILK